MKKYLAIVLVLIFAAGCKKDQPVQRVTGLVGKWELRYEMGGFVGRTTYVAGTGNTIQFNADSTLAQYQNFSIVRQGSYSVVKKGTVFAGIAFDELYYNHNLWNVMQLKGDTLVIGTTVADGLADTYVRQ